MSSNPRICPVSTQFWPDIVENEDLENEDLENEDLENKDPKKGRPRKRQRSSRR